MNGTGRTPSLSRIWALRSSTVPALTLTDLPVSVHRGADPPLCWEVKIEASLFEKLLTDNSGGTRTAVNFGGLGN